MSAILIATANVVIASAKICKRATAFTIDTFRAHHNIIGKYTAPVEKTVLNQDPPTPKDLNRLGQIALTIIPVTVLAWLCSILITPFLFNSLLTLIGTFVRVANIAFIDLPEESKIPQAKGSMTWYQLIYGFPGMLLGFALGTLSGFAILAGRMVTNTFKNLTITFVKILNLTLDKQIKSPYQHKEQYALLKILGFLGYPLGLVLGSLAVIVISSGSMLTNTFFSMITGFRLDKNAQINESTLLHDVLTDDGRPTKDIFGFGLIGIVTGLSLGTLWRFFRESYKNIRRIHKETANFAMGESTEPSEAEQQRSKLDKFLFGSLGFIVSIGTAPILFGLIMTGRVVYHSIWTAYSLTASAFNLFRHRKIEHSGITHDARVNTLKFGFGFFGFVLAIVPAFIAASGSFIERTCIDSYKSFVQVLKTSFNVVLDKEDALKKDTHPRSTADIYFFGGLGLLLGATLTLPCLLVILGVRMVTNTYNTGKLTLVRITNLGLDKEDQLKTDNKKLTRAQILLGLPGFVFGGILGSISLLAVVFGRSVTNTFYTARYVIKAILKWQAYERNAADTASNAIKSNLQHSKARSPLVKYGLGFFGILIGAMIGFIARTVITTSKSTRDTFVHLLNLGLAEEDALKLPHKKRTILDAYFFGFIGIVIGLSLSLSLGLPLVILGRTITNSFETIKNLTFSTVNLFREKDKEYPYAFEQDTRSKIRQFFFGFPGLIIGLIPATLAFVLGVTIESVLTIRDITQAILDWKVYEIDDQNQTIPDDFFENKPKKRSPMMQYGVGILGLIPGILIGLSTRIAAASWRSTRDVFILLVNVTLDKEDELKKRRKRSFIDILLFGFIGGLVGLIPSLIAMPIVILGRMLTNSFITAVNLTFSAVNLFHEDDKQYDLDLKHNTRSNFRTYALGFFGLFFGVVPAFSALVVESGLLILKNSFLTAFDLINKYYRFALSKPDPLISKNDHGNPSVFHSYMLGFPGFILGHMIGPLVFSTIFIAKLIQHNGVMMVEGFITVFNLGLADKEQIPYLTEDLDLKNPWDTTYLKGFMGLSIGAGFGLLGLAAFSFYHAAISWLKFSGSFLNLSLGAHLIPTIGEDKRPTKQKVMGALGYLFALATTLPLAMVISTCRLVIPFIFTLIISLVLSPLIALGKAISLAVKEPRFAQNKEHEPPVMQKFRNLYSSLDFKGEFVEDKSILDNQNGGKGFKSYLRKSFSLNTSSIDEKTLNTIFKAYKKSNDPNLFFEQEFKSAVKETKDYFSALSFMEYNDTKQAREQRIDNVSHFIKNYIQGTTDKPEKTKPTHYFNLWFLGQTKVVSLDKENNSLLDEELTHSL